MCLYRCHSCVLQGSLRTGSVFHGIVDYFREHGAKLDALGLENVATIHLPPRNKQRDVVGPSNLDCVSYIMREELGKIVVSFDLCPTMFGVPQTRRRIWMTAVSANFPCQDRVIYEMMEDIMDRIVGIEMSPVQEYLLSETDPAIASVSTQ